MKSETEWTALSICSQYPDSQRSPTCRFQSSTLLRASQSMRKGAELLKQSHVKTFIFNYKRIKIKTLISCPSDVRWESFIRREGRTILCSKLWCVLYCTVALAYTCQETFYFIQINAPAAPTTHCLHHFTLLLETLWQFSKRSQEPDRV